MPKYQILPGPPRKIINKRAPGGEENEDVLVQTGHNFVLYANAHVLYIFIWVEEEK